jgi:hypothetical protein
LPASRREVPNRWLAVKVIVAVAWFRNAVDAADDNVCAQRLAGAEGTVGHVGRTDDLAAVAGGCQLSSDRGEERD